MKKDQCVPRRPPRARRGSARGASAPDWDAPAGATPVGQRRCTAQPLARGIRGRRPRQGRASACPSCGGHSGSRSGRSPRVPKAAERSARRARVRWPTHLRALTCAPAARVPARPPARAPSDCTTAARFRMRDAGRYIARARTAKATSKVNDMLSDVGSSSAVAAFERMKDKVEALEAEAETQRELKQLQGSQAPVSMEAKFKARATHWRLFPRARALASASITPSEPAPCVTVSPFVLPPLAPRPLWACAHRRSKATPRLTTSLRSCGSRCRLRRRKVSSGRPTASDSRCRQQENRLAR